MTQTIALPFGLFASFGWVAAWPTSPPPLTEGSGTMPDQLEISYRARDGRLPVDLDLHLGPDGQAQVYIGTSYSIPLARVSRVGTFSGPAPTAEVNALRTYLDGHDLLARGGSHGQWNPDAPERFLEIRANGREAQLTLSGM